MPVLRCVKICQKCQENLGIIPRRVAFVFWRGLVYQSSSTPLYSSSNLYPRTSHACTRNSSLQSRKFLINSLVSSQSFINFSTTTADRSTTINSGSTTNYGPTTSDNIEDEHLVSPGVYWQNTFILGQRAMTDYLLEMEDLEGLSKRAVRSAHNSSTRPVVCYLKSDVEKRALEVWGSWKLLENELEKRREKAEEMEMRRKGLGSLITYLKKVNKDQIRRVQDKETFGGREERVSLVKGSAKVVLYAIASNFTVLVFKLLAYSYTGSATMLSEAVHSVADILNQFLLAFGIAQSIRVPDPDHPYGWSRARYVYSLISGVGIFFIGAGVTCYHGIQGLLNPHIVVNLSVAFSVLGASLLVEGLSLLSAIRQVRRSAKESGVGFKDYVLRGRDPSAVAVLVEDSAAIAGILLAGSALTLTHITGSVIYDAIGSITVGGLLGVVALFLVQRNSNALVGQSIPPERLKQITDLLESDIIIRSIHDVKATDMGADSVRFKAEVNFDGREVARMQVEKLDLEQALKDVQTFTTAAEMEKFLLEYGEQVVDVLGAEVDRIELKIKKQSPEVRHVDLEIL